MRFNFSAARTLAVKTSWRRSASERYFIDTPNQVCVKPGVSNFGNLRGRLIIEMPPISEKIVQRLPVRLEEVVPGAIDTDQHKTIDLSRKQARRWNDPPTTVEQTLTIHVFAKIVLGEMLAHFLGNARIIHEEQHVPHWHCVGHTAGLKHVGYPGGRHIGQRSTGKTIDRIRFRDETRWGHVLRRRRYIAKPLKRGVSLHRKRGKETRWRNCQRYGSCSGTRTVRQALTDTRAAYGTHQPSAQPALGGPLSLRRPRRSDVCSRP